MLTNSEYEQACKVKERIRTLEIELALEENMGRAYDLDVELSNLERWLEDLGVT